MPGRHIDEHSCSVLLRSSADRKEVAIPFRMSIKSWYAQNAHRRTSRFSLPISEELPLEGESLHWRIQQSTGSWYGLLDLAKSDRYGHFKPDSEEILEIGPGVVIFLQVTEPVRIE